MTMETPGEPVIARSSDERLWGMLCHLSALAILIIPYIGAVIGPLVVWLLKKDQYPFVDDQGKESLNFQISILIYSTISAILAIVLIGFVLLFILLVLDIILVIVASVAANEGRAYRYPLTIRFIV
ncbi:MAG TPA: DUF4870 domain-containing protein [Armatimonadota bacterium]|nr:DUF4870 domain-containing protein [Armatimonadota bacterium]